MDKGSGYEIDHDKTDEAIESVEESLANRINNRGKTKNKKSHKQLKLAQSIVTDPFTINFLGMGMPEKNFNVAQKCLKKLQKKYKVTNKNCKQKFDYQKDMLGWATMIYSLPEEARLFAVECLLDIRGAIKTKKRKVSIGHDNTPTFRSVDCPIDGPGDPYYDGRPGGH